MFAQAECIGYPLKNIMLRLYHKIFYKIMKYLGLQIFVPKKMPILNFFYIIITENSAIL